MLVMTRTYSNTLLDYLEQLPSNGGGIFRGFWLDLIVQQSVATNQTVVNYKAWRCDVGRPYSKQFLLPPLVIAADTKSVSYRACE